MYRYDQFDHTLVTQRVDQFRDQVQRRLAGDLSEEEFKPLRLMNGLYLQLHAYMLRVAIPYGVLSSRQMRALATIARTYDKDYGHFTTRQNIQYNWIKLEQICDLLADLARVEMHAIQTSGNCIRNVTADPWAGACPDEVEDPRIYCEIIRQWSTFHPEFSFLPRKFKIAVTAAEPDRAAVKFHDIGLIIRRNGQGHVGFEVLVGGGQGRTPRVAQTIRPFLAKTDLLSYLEAILRVYNRYGRRDNLFKARIKILVENLGIDAMREKVDAEWQTMRGPIGAGGLDLPQAEIDRIHAYFTPPAWKNIAQTPDKNEDVRLDMRGGGRAGAAPSGVNGDLNGGTKADRNGDTKADRNGHANGDPRGDLKGDRNGDFDRFVRYNTAPHRQPGYAIVTISLKSSDMPPGDAGADQMDAIADLAKRYSFDEVRVTHSQNLVLPHVEQTDIAAVWQELCRIGLGHANIDMISDIICCPGMDYCALATARSIPVAKRIQDHFHDLRRQYDIGSLQIKISGCINACGHHHAGHIGILGVDRRGEEYYQITLGGSADHDATVGRIIGPAFSARDIIGAIDTIVATYLDLRRDGEIFLQTWRRIGLAPFKERLYAAS